jgi:hypothetical protein
MNAKFHGHTLVTLHRNLLVFTFKSTQKNKINKMLFWCGTIDSVYSTLSYRAICVCEWDETNEKRKCAIKVTQTKLSSENFHSINGSVYAGMIKNNERKNTSRVSLACLIFFCYCRCNLLSLTNFFIIPAISSKMNFSFGWKRLKNSKRERQVFECHVTINKRRKTLSWIFFLFIALLPIINFSLLLFFSLSFFRFFSNWKAIEKHRDPIISVQWSEERERKKINYEIEIASDRFWGFYARLHIDAVSCWTLFF